MATDWRPTVSELLLIFAVASIPCPAPAAEPDDILFLGIKHKNPEAASKAVQQRIERMGERITAAMRRLRSADRGCHTLDCLKAIASTHNSAWVLGGEVQTNAPRDYSITLWLYDARGDRVLDEEESCRDCNEELLGNALSTAAGRIIHQRREPPIKPALEPDTPAAPSLDTRAVPNPAAAARAAEPTAPAAADLVLAKPKPRLSPRRVTTAAVLGATLLAVLATGIALSLVDPHGPCPQKENATCSYSGFSGIVGYSLSGVLAAGLALTLALP